MHTQENFQKEAVEETKRQNAAAKRNSSMTPAKVNELRERLTKQRGAINDVEEAIELLQAEKVQLVLFVFAYSISRYLDRSSSERCRSAKRAENNQSVAEHVPKGVWRSCRAP